MNTRLFSNFLKALLVFSQLLLIMGLGQGFTWCQHADGQARVESAIQQAECHDQQARGSEGAVLKSCTDIPVNSEQPSQKSGDDHSRKLSALRAATLVWVLPNFGIVFDFSGSQSVIRPLADDETPPHDVVLDSLSTVILLT